MHDFMNLSSRRKRRWRGPWIAVLACGLGSGAALPALRAAESTPVPGAPVEAPTLELLRDGARLRITFDGVLESAGDLRGPWNELPDAVSPLVHEPTASQTFFRARRGTVESIFGSRTIAALTVQGPLQTHFDLALAGLPDGIFPPRREKPYFDGTVLVAGFELPVELRVRGNSSLQECPFPKLKLKVARADRIGTPFADAREIKLGTHCWATGTRPCRWTDVGCGTPT